MHLQPQTPLSEVREDAEVFNPESRITTSPSPVIADSSHMTEDESHVTTATAEQIMELLDQLEESASVAGDVVMECRHCTGELMVV